MDERSSRISEAGMRRLTTSLASLDLEATFEGGVVRLGILPQGAVHWRGELMQESDRLKVWHFDVRFFLNASQSDSCIHSCCTGWGKTDEEATGMAVESWTRTTLPPVMSVLRQEPVLEAQWLPPGDPLGLHGWGAFSSPYVFYGDHASAQQLQEWVDTRDLLGSIRATLSERLDRGVLFHSVALTVGFVGTTVETDCIIDGNHDEALAQTLHDDFVGPDFREFAAVQQSLLCLRH